MSLVGVAATLTLLGSLAAATRIAGHRWQNYGLAEERRLEREEQQAHIRRRALGETP